MSIPSVQFTVFTKPWAIPLSELGALVQRLGFLGVELPVRPGFQVEPERVRTELPKAVGVLNDYGVTICSVAGPTDEATIAACGEAGVPIIRICIGIPRGRNYLEHEEQVRRDFDALVPMLDRSGVTIGVQNHNGRFVANALGLRRLVERYDPRHIAAVWDPAHCALDGETPELAADILWSHLRLVNLKNAYWQRANGLEAESAAFRPHWTSGRQGLCSWPEVARILQERGYHGRVCLTAEYSDHDSVDRLIAEDLEFARSLW